MNKLFLTLALAAGIFVSAPNAYARDQHHQGGHKHHHGTVHRHGQQHHHHHQNWNGFHYNRPGFNLYIGPGYRYPAPYPRPYPYPPRTYPTPAPVTVLVTEYCYGKWQTRFVVARWDRYYGGYWYYDCMGVYRRAR